MGCFNVLFVFKVPAIQIHQLKRSPHVSAEKGALPYITLDDYDTTRSHVLFPPALAVEQIRELCSPTTGTLPPALLKRGSSCGFSPDTGNRSDGMVIIQGLVAPVPTRAKALDDSESHVRQRRRTA